MHRKTGALLLDRGLLHWKVCCSSAMLLAKKHICFGGNQDKSVNFRGFLLMGSHMSDTIQKITFRFYFYMRKIWQWYAPCDHKTKLFYSSFLLPGHLVGLLSHLCLAEKTVPLLFTGLIYRQLPILCLLCILHITFPGYEEEDWFSILSPNFSDHLT